MTTKATFKKRRQKLANFLRKLDSTEFDIRYFSISCGTVCCALGWCPEVFPKAWTMGTIGVPFLRNRDDLSGFGSASSYFGMSSVDVMHVFDMRGYINLPTPRFVAERILDTPYVLRNKARAPATKAAR